MQEHELKEYQRLRAEGQWIAASEFREAERKRLRTAGRNRQQARDESWEAMLEKYPPQDGQKPGRRSAVALDRWSEADAADSERQLDEHNQDAEFAEVSLGAQNQPPKGASKPAILRVERCRAHCLRRFFPWTGGWHVESAINGTNTGNTSTCGDRKIESGDIEGSGN